MTTRFLALSAKEWCGCNQNEDFKRIRLWVIKQVCFENFNFAILFEYLGRDIE